MTDVVGFTDPLPIVEIPSNFPVTAVTKFDVVFTPTTGYLNCPMNCLLYDSSCNTLSILPEVSIGSSPNFSIIANKPSSA